MVRRDELTDAQWQKSEPLLPANGKPGGQWSDHRKVLNGGCCQLIGIGVLLGVWQGVVGPDGSPGSARRGAAGQAPPPRCVTCRSAFAPGAWPASSIPRREGTQTILMIT